MKILKKLIAECIGTFVLVFFACGVAAATGGALVATSLTFGLVIVAMAYSIGRISGCHINPAVSFGLYLSKKMSGKEFLLYCAAQMVGGFLGACALFGFAKMFGAPLAGDACNSVAYLEKIPSVLAAILIEAILTFVFVYVILNVTDEKNNGAGKKAGLIIGLTLTLVHLLGINFTGTSVNPARSVATALGALIFNGNVEPIKVAWVFVIAPLFGAAVAALVFKYLHKEEK